MKEEILTNQFENSPSDDNPYKCSKIIVLPYLCQTCGQCITACDIEAISFGNDNKAYIDSMICSRCGRCVKTCSYYAIRPQY